jgi:hypothetical protein
VMAHIPTNAAVQCLGHDIVSPKDHALRYCFQGQGASLSAPLPLAERIAMPLRRCRPCVRSSL